MTDLNPISEEDRREQGLSPLKFVHPESSEQGGEISIEMTKQTKSKVIYTHQKYVDGEQNRGQGDTEESAPLKNDNEDKTQAKTGDKEEDAKDKEDLDLELEANIDSNSSKGVYL
jgi:hypothetical protein